MGIKTYVDGMLLPVNPLEELPFATNSNNKSQDIVSLGEVTFLGPRKLATFEIRSLFTSTRYPFTVDGARLDPMYFINQIYAAMDAERAVRVIRTGDGDTINMLCSIEGFKHEERFGQIGEYFYELSLKEYRAYGVKTVRIANSTSVQASITTREESPPETGNYTVVKGDCLSHIAQAQLGSSSRWREIYNLNQDQISNPNKIYPGQMLIMPGR
ncbi:LysM peptidoglycan-binding domain-containing protein [Christensenellaceae bacterium OttesenSCG-928-M15]|nr:LysM peptidoglycan-binding domain-containing protein [Christensenellaceae bacterium OttesenSCG-928-M15]